ncbi:MAG: bile acid:sodium symporter family protein [candidate division KSB1 bacterium]|nr:bile acid:sodium symporter family protein [candidate division KSB1 bacterium]MDZ7273589.1 bile acid:sodium symporter family protein [candidate division KSB1 bacterium]MDZ7286820.1 bile acid:sodium symporter family protein [candidate division KSB1 bacterium]MDZ7299823.1 bile acid:sodium symporter family protein [candidate division KSB1 bacterium]MDZ7308452.1 bile acid:sodium symporter family protein [candidate division KSB1 bacterium]
MTEEILSLPALDAIPLNFNPATLTLLNVILGVVMFGIALDLQLGDFKLVLQFPRSILIGMLGQFILLPALSFVLVCLLAPAASMALGMLLVAACPGGNLSNFLTYFARGNTPLSVCMTACSTAAALVLTPLNFTFWGSLYPPAHALLRKIALDPVDLMTAVLLLLGLPLALGLLLAYRRPRLATALKRPMKILSLLFFGGFVLAALLANWDNFVNHVGRVAFAVMVQNGLALAGGYAVARAARLPEPDCRAIAIEIGIQNSGLGLLLIFNFFGGLGGMALVAAWWGIWHIISGTTLAWLWSLRPPAAGNTRGISQG